MFSSVRFRLNKKIRENEAAKKRLQKMNTYDPKFVDDLTSYKDLLQALITIIDKYNLFYSQNSEEQVLSLLGYAKENISDKTKEQISQALKWSKEYRAATLKACDYTLREKKPTPFAFRMYLDMYKMEADRKKTKPKIRVRIVDNQLQEVKRVKVDWITIGRGQWFYQSQLQLFWLVIWLQVL